MAPCDHLPGDFVAAMDDDLATPRAVAALFSEISAGNKAITDGDADALQQHLRAVGAMLTVFGLDPDAPEWANERGSESAALEPVVDGLVQTLLQQRADARARKDWAAADGIRDALAASGLRIEDTPQGARWTLDK